MISLSSTSVRYQKNDEDEKGRRGEGGDGKKMQQNSGLYPRNINNKLGLKMNLSMFLSIFI